MTPRSQFDAELDRAYYSYAQGGARNRLGGLDYLLAMNKTRTRPPTRQWGNFLRNHDELDLGRLTEKERQTVFAAFGPNPQDQLCDRGIRRRLAPMLGGDRRRIELATA